jgi:hypothetical protein
VAHAARPDPAPLRARGRDRAGRPHREHRLPRRPGTLTLKEPHPCFIDVVSLGRGDSRENRYGRGSAWRHYSISGLRRAGARPGLQPRGDRPRPLGGYLRQIALDEDGQLVGAGDLEAQARQVFANLDRDVEDLPARHDMETGSPPGRDRVVADDLKVYRSVRAGLPACVNRIRGRPGLGRSQRSSPGIDKDLSGIPGPNYLRSSHIDKP